MPKNHFTNFKPKNPLLRYYNFSKKAIYVLSALESSTHFLSSLFIKSLNLSPALFAINFKSSFNVVVSFVVFIEMCF